MNFFNSVLLGAALVLPGSAFASVSLSCAAAVCSAFVRSPSSPAPFSYKWGGTYAPGTPHVPITFPHLCGNNGTMTWTSTDESFTPTGTYAIKRVTTLDGLACS